MLHTFEESETNSEQCVRLLRRAKEADEWELCKELARFLMALDESGDLLRDAVERMEIGSSEGEGEGGRSKTPTQRSSGRAFAVREEDGGAQSPGSSVTDKGAQDDDGGSDGDGRGGKDYFS